MVSMYEPLELTAVANGLPIPTYDLGDYTTVYTTGVPWLPMCTQTRPRLQANINYKDNYKDSYKDNYKDSYNAMCSTDLKELEQRAASS